MSSGGNFGLVSILFFIPKIQFKFSKINCIVVRKDCIKRKFITMIMVPVVSLFFIATIYTLDTDVEWTNENAIKNNFHLNSVYKHTFGLLFILSAVRN